MTPSYSSTGTRESRQVAMVAAPMITAPPISGQKPGASRWTSHAQSGLNAGSASSSSDAAAAGTWRNACDRSKYDAPTWNTPR